ncbi:MAG: MBL fold metallo-hydrolase [FCB group bacterium]|nr:MBL fold metallo-hydrolase [FCB group bacterium]
MYKFGDFTIYHLIERKFKLDGGSMFGIVPKKIWGRLVEVDDDNLVPMQTNLFVVDTGEAKILCDTGLGDLLSEKEQKIYAAFEPSGLESALAELGFSPDDIDYVFLSHLHTDHAGGVTVEEDGLIVPRFHNAQYVIQSQEWYEAMHPNERTEAVYIADRLRPLKIAGQLRLVDGGADILPGVRLVKTGGHTAGHMGMEFTSDGKTVVYYADIVPFSHHIKVPYVAAVDMFPLNTMKVKRLLLRRALADEFVIAFDHDTEIPLGTVHEDGLKTVVKPVI